MNGSVITILRTKMMNQYVQIQQFFTAMALPDQAMADTTRWVFWMILCVPCSGRYNIHTFYVWTNQNHIWFLLLPPVILKAGGDFIYEKNSTFRQISFRPGIIRTQRITDRNIKYWKSGSHCRSLRQFGHSVRSYFRMWSDSCHNTGMRITHLS